MLYFLQAGKKGKPCFVYDEKCRFFNQNTIEKKYIYPNAIAQKVIIKML